VWEDHKIDLQEEKDCGGWDEVIDLDRDEEYVGQAVKNADKVYINIKDDKIINLISGFKDTKFTSYENIMQLIENHRAIKSTE